MEQLLDVHKPCAAIVPAIFINDIEVLFVVDGQEALTCHLLNDNVHDES